VTLKNSKLLALAALLQRQPKLLQAPLFISFFIPLLEVLQNPYFALYVSRFARAINRNFRFPEKLPRRSYFTDAQIGVVHYISLESIIVFRGTQQLDLFIFIFPNGLKWSSPFVYVCWASHSTAHGLAHWAEKIKSASLV
jgi:hypothetical protein